MTPPLTSARVPLRNGAAHFIEGLLRLRRFRKPDQGGADFVMRSPTAIGALLRLENSLSSRCSQITEPGCIALAADYAAYWTPTGQPDALNVTLAFEPQGLPAPKASPFSLTLVELQQIAEAIRALHIDQIA